MRILTSFFIVFPSEETRTSILVRKGIATNGKKMLTFVFTILVLQVVIVFLCRIAGNW